MMRLSFTSCLVLSFLLPLIFCDEQQLPPQCSFSLYYIPHFPRPINVNLDEPVRIFCERVGSDNQTLDEVLYRSAIPDRSPINQRSFRFPRLAEWVREIRIGVSPGNNITVKPGALPFLPLLESLNFESKWPPTKTPMDQAYYLVIHEHLFEKMPRMRSLTVHGLGLAESTMQAFSSLKHRLNRLDLTWVVPGRRLLDVVHNFTNLTHLTLDDVCENQSFPLTAFRSSAPKLKSLSIKLCNIQTMSRDLFRSMRNLQDLEWRYSSIGSIGENSFDDLINLEELDLAYNKLSVLPDGLFKRNRKLKNVDFVGNDGIVNLSRSNFSHVQSYENFQLNIARGENGGDAMEYRKKLKTTTEISLDDFWAMNGTWTTGDSQDV